MATKRKRQIQDDADQDFENNFQLLRHLGEQKRKKLDIEERKQEIKVSIIHHDPDVCSW